MCNFLPLLLHLHFCDLLSFYLKLQTFLHLEKVLIHLNYTNLIRESLNVHFVFFKKNLL